MSDLGNANWSETDASNNATPPNGWPEGMNPSDVNNAARANMGALKRWWDRSNTVLTTAGTSTAYTLTNAVAGAAYYAGEEFAFIVNATCGVAPTLNIDGLGAQNLRKFVNGAWTTLLAGDIVANQTLRVYYNGSATTFDIVASSVNPVLSSNTWTPTDGSGASLSFTSVNANYQKIGNLIFAYFGLVYPATANGSAAMITLPVAVPNQTYTNIPANVYTVGAGSGVFIKPIPNTSTAVFLTVNGSGLTNANMSTFTVSSMITYPAS